jgi:hypothetical protein
MARDFEMVVQRGFAANCGAAFQAAMTASKRAFGSVDNKRLLESSRGKLETCSTGSAQRNKTFVAQAFSLCFAG